jgi:hypothetical protein
MAYEALAWANSTPSTTDQVDGAQSYNMGTRFSLVAARNAIGVQWRVPDTLAAPGGGGIYAVAIWNIGTGVRVAYKEFTPVAGGYQDVAFDAPVALSSGTNYAASVYTLHYTFRASAASTTSPSGNIVSDSGLFATYNGGAAAAPIPATTSTTGFYVSPLIETTNDLVSTSTNTVTHSLTGATQLSTQRATTNTVTNSLTGTTAREGLTATTNTVTHSLTGTTQLSTQRATTNTASLSLTGTSTANALAAATHTITFSLTGVSSGGSGGGQDFTSTSTSTLAVSLAGQTARTGLTAATHTVTITLTGVSSGGASTGPEVSGMDPVYTTRERVMRAADVKASAYRNQEIDLAIQAGARRIDSLCNRGDSVRPGFAPWTGTITYDWPNVSSGNTGNSFRLWLAPHAIASITSMTSGGQVVTSQAYGWPADAGAPFPAIALDRTGAYALEPGSGAGQRSAVITGVWMGAANDERTSTNWLLGSSPSSSQGSMTINAPFGVGQILRIDSERMIVNDRTWSASGQTGTLAASMSAETLAVADGTAFFADEELILDSERIWIRDIVGNNLIVKRAVSGSILAAHSGVPIQWSRTAIVERGVLGTTAAAHTSGTRVYFAKAPALIEQLNVAYALDQRAQETSGYARTIGSQESEKEYGARGVKELEKAVTAAYGRQVRHRAI